uniref:ABC transporter transmembrane domain-containing protein n=1 Tax=Bacillus altitudinis TaxID=293387 RepID=UPI002356B8DD
LRYYPNTRTGQIISTVINDVQQTNQFLITRLINISLDFITLLILIPIISTLHLKLTILSLIIFPLYPLALNYFYARLPILTKHPSQPLP